MYGLPERHRAVDGLEEIGFHLIEADGAKWCPILQRLLQRLFRLHERRNRLWISIPRYCEHELPGMRSLAGSIPAGRPIQSRQMILKLVLRDEAAGGPRVLWRSRFQKPSKHRPLCIRYYYRNRSIITSSSPALFVNIVDINIDIHVCY